MIRLFGLNHLNFISEDFEPIPFRAILGKTTPPLLARLDLWRCRGCPFILFTFGDCLQTLMVRTFSVFRHAIIKAAAIF